MIRPAFRGRTFIALSAAVAAGLALLAYQALPADAGCGLVVHEWGTFTSVFSSDGRQLPGVHRDDVDLPEFVVPRGGAWGPVRYGLRDALLAEPLGATAGVTQKMETPVTYFYTQRPMKVSVKVRYPHGIFTHWYPAVAADAPAFPHTGPALADGLLDWGTLDLVPAGEATPELVAALPAVPASHIWQFARETESAYVRTRAGTADAPGAAPQTEKYLFYRGLADFPSPVTAAHSVSKTSDHVVTLENRGPDRVEHVYVMNVPPWTVGGRFSSDPFAAGASFVYVPALQPGERRTVDLHATPEQGKKPLLALADELGERLEQSLTATGLFAAEARAMRRTWHASYFFTPGVRVLFVMPQRQTDALLPLEIAPAPMNLLRIMVGRLEVLDEGRESAVGSALASLPAALTRGDQLLLDYERLALLREGRFLEPILHALAGPAGAVGAEARRAIAQLHDGHAREITVLGPDRVSLPAATSDPLRMTAAERTARAAEVRAWLALWEPYAARTKCDLTGIRDARLEVALLGYVDQAVRAGKDPATLSLPTAHRVLPICPAGCGCGAARMTGARPPTDPE
ncbi:MAG: hypothetical protein HZA54_13605 [Planctomycetes bacterium]|nr:hypothetical protein [Planctomycetota bacterium]